MYEEISEYKTEFVTSAFGQVTGKDFPAHATRYMGSVFNLYPVNVDFWASSQ
jgi:hypothetical protein